MELYGGIEAGGTKFYCIVASGPDQILAETRFATTTPAETILQIVKFYQHQRSLGNEIEALGLGCFGPLDLNPSSSQYGAITSTPKPGWQNTLILGELQNLLGVRVTIDTDVNAAAVGEGIWGAAQGLENFVYITIGTGIGEGVVVNGRPVHGLLHPEMGHILIPHDKQMDPFEGSCPFHGDCWEGLASGPAMLKRWGQPAETLPPDHPAWQLEVEYIALALQNLICTISPQRIILGGGVMKQTHLFPLIQQKVIHLLNGYLQKEELSVNIGRYIVPPGLGGRSGVLGALALAQQMS